MLFAKLIPFFILLAIKILFISHFCHAIICNRGPQYYPETGPINPDPLLLHIRSSSGYDCTSHKKCLVALNCNVNPIDDKIYNLTGRGLIKIHETDCVKETTYIHGKEYGPEEICHKFYKIKRGCESCRICDQDYCNEVPAKAFVPSRFSLLFVFILIGHFLQILLTFNEEFS